MINYELAELMIEQTSDAIIYVDTLGDIHRWNEAAYNYLAFPKKKL